MVRARRHAFLRPSAIRRKLVERVIDLRLRRIRRANQKRGADGSQPSQRSLCAFVCQLEVRGLVKLTPVLVALDGRFGVITYGPQVLPG